MIEFIVNILEAIHETNSIYELIKMNCDLTYDVHSFKKNNILYLLKTCK